MIKSSRLFATNGSIQSVSPKATTNSEMLSRQIESLRVVLRRMKATQSSSVDSLIHQKLKELQ